jgi:hypothetical protein
MLNTTFSVRDVQARHAVGVHTVLHWIATGQLRAVNISRNPGAKKPRWRITQEALDAFELTRTPIPQLPRTRRRKRRVDFVEFYR